MNWWVNFSQIALILWRINLIILLFPVKYCFMDLLKFSSTEISEPMVGLLAISFYPFCFVIVLSYANLMTYEKYIWIANALNFLYLLRSLTFVYRLRSLTYFTWFSAQSGGFLLVDFNCYSSFVLPKPFSCVRSTYFMSDFD